MSKAVADIGKFGSSVGLLIDRCVKREEPFGTAWSVGDDKVVTPAHLIVMYMEMLPALKVRFPSLNQDWEIVDVKFHPKFDQKTAMEMAHRSLTGPVPAMALQDNNLAILRLARHLSALDREQMTTFNKRLSATPVPHRKGLGGSIDELGLALVVQTMTNSRKDGTIVLTDERNRPLAKLFCRDGRIVYAKFGKLANEHAVYQMFSQQMSGQFAFQGGNKPDWPVSSNMERPTDMLLIEAHRRLDEIPKMLSELGGIGATYRRVGDVFNESVIREDVRRDAEAVWRCLDGGLSVDQLWDVACLDNYSVYQALMELSRTMQACEVPYGSDNDLNPFQPLDMAPYLPLSPWDEILSLNVHPSTGRPQVRRGSLVGCIRPNDPYHLLHNIALPYRGAGSPLFKDGQVVGMHCGMLPLDPQMYALPTHLHQMIWVDSIVQALSGAVAPSPGKKATGMVKKSVGIQRPVSLSDSIAGKIECTKCHSLMVKQARFCGTCGFKMP